MSPQAFLNTFKEWHLTAINAPHKSLLAPSKTACTITRSVSTKLANIRTFTKLALVIESPMGASRCQSEQLGEFQDYQSLMLEAVGRHEVKGVQAFCTSAR